LGRKSRKGSRTYSVRSVIASLESSTLVGTGLEMTIGAVARRTVVTIVLKCIVALDEVLDEWLYFVVFDYLELKLRLLAFCHEEQRRFIYNFSASASLSERTENFISLGSVV
jgi:hypothetical protein